MQNWIHHLNNKKWDVKIRETNKKKGPALASRIFFRFLIFDCYNIRICKKGRVKDEASKKIRKTNGGQIKKQDVPLT